MVKMGDKQYNGYDMVGSGLAGVWARENTRKAIYDAMMRKETCATTGSRMLMPFFGGWDFSAADASNRLPGDVGYLKGVSMGRGANDDHREGLYVTHLVRTSRLNFVAQDQAPEHTTMKES